MEKKEMLILLKPCEALIEQKILAFVSNFVAKNSSKDKSISVHDLKKLLNINHFRSQDALDNRLKDLLSRCLETFQVFIFDSDGGSEIFDCCRPVNALLWGEGKDVIMYEENREFKELVERKYEYSWIRLIQNRSNLTKTPICKKNIEFINFFGQV